MILTIGGVAILTIGSVVILTIGGVVILTIGGVVILTIAIGEFIATMLVVNAPGCKHQLSLWWFHESHGLDQPNVLIRHHR